MIASLMIQYFPFPFLVTYVIPVLFHMQVQTPALTPECNFDYANAYDTSNEIITTRSVV